MPKQGRMEMNGEKVYWDGKASRATAISVGAGTSRRSGIGAGCFNIELRNSDKDSEKVTSKGWDGILLSW